VDGAPDKSVSQIQNKQIREGREVSEQTMTPSEVLDLLDNGFLELTDVPLVRAAVAELAQENERFRSNEELQIQRTIEAAFERDALRRRVDELERDAKRYGARINPTNSR